MQRSIENQLNESYRDALVAYYLSEVVPNHIPLVTLGLHTRLKTANDLYEFFLIDNQVSNDVQTSPVASAIASLQQYINGTLMGMEPGYTALRTDEPQFVEWKDRSSQYPIWAANQQLALYPEIYISPELRLKKSMYFAQLENDINQNKISIDTTQDAVKSYLASFEEVANLTIVNGYIDGSDFATGKYYFIGKSRAEDKYYWRMVDMNERAYLSGTEGPKDDNPTPGAWSDWKHAELGISANTIERTIRPVFFNNRLFVVWVDLIQVADEVALQLKTPAGDPPYPAPAPAPAEGEEQQQVVITPKVQLLLNISYKKYDDSWSAPQIYMDVTRSNILGANKTMLNEALNTIAVFDASHSPESLFIGMYAGESLTFGDKDGSYSLYEFLKTAFIDKNFNFTPAFPVKETVTESVNASALELEEVRIRKACWVFALYNKARFQFYWHTQVSLTIAKTTALNPDNQNWNYSGLQPKITDITTEANRPVIDQEKATVRLCTDVNERISTPSVAITLTFTAFFMNWTFNLVVDPTSPDMWLPLLLGSSVTNPYLPGTIELNLWPSAASDPTIIRLPNFLRDSGVNPLTLALGENSLEGKVIWRSAIQLFLVHDDPDWTISGDMHSVDWPALSSGMSELVINVAPPVTFQQYFSYPIDMSAPGTGQMHYRGSGQNVVFMDPSNPFYVDIPFDRSTLLPIGFNTHFLPDSKAFYVTHGVGVNTTSPPVWIANAIKSTMIELLFVGDLGNCPVAPMTTKRADPNLGVAEYIDFTGSSIRYSDGSNSEPRKPIRMNTLFARELIQKANIALEALLSWGTQQLLEPPIGDQSESPPMDFKGANGLYFWELFLHLPFMIAHRLTLEKQFKESDFWLGFIFDPARKAAAGASDSGAPDYWNVRPLVEISDPDYFMRAPIDPDGIAASDPVRYQKAIYSHYIKNMIERGDMAYRQLTPDSLNEAKLWYVRVLDLLGPRPDTRLVSRWAPQTLGALAESTRAGLREFEAKLIDQQQQVRASANANGGQSRVSFKQAPLRLSTFGRDPTLMDADTDYFIPPMNSELVKHWDTVESRLYNLRNNFTLDGKPLQLPLFAAPLDPRALLAAYANGAAGGGAGSLLAQEVPHFRYAVMAARASAAVETLIQFGNTLLSIIERKDQAEYMEMQQELAWEFAQFAIDLQLETQKVEIMARKSLEASKAIADARAVFYDNLAIENVSAGEIAAMTLQALSRVYEGVGAVADGIASMLKPVPSGGGANVGAEGGMTFGAHGGASVSGIQIEGVAQAVGIGARAQAMLLHTTGEALEKTEQYRRRLQEWENLRDQAVLESEALTAQLAVHDAQIRVTVIQLRQAQEAKNQAEKMYAFLKKQRFSNTQLYQWLTGQFSMLYYQAYDATVSLCLAAEACWQYERADFTTRFIKPSAWNDTYRGLLSGESLKLDLLRMETAFLSRHERLLEIVKTVSVRQLPPSTDDVLTLNREWADVVMRLSEEGAVEFEITQAMLDEDYPGQTLRRIKRISVSLPVTVGPYQDIRAILTQSYNAVQIGNTLKENMRASQQIAVSTGIDDDGLFVFNFDDERYLPFEGTGAISRWRLDFPHFDGSQKDMIASITDIIVHIRYTAKAGGINPGKSIEAPGKKRASKRPSI
ncbi:neuraminidase-like domain-containing protein [Pseudomonas sp. W5-01]|uniref:Tc toxin subunit A-related protein n=1 Tax=Pseudomonas sp. W5-01 TaxID=3097454 RepID=UPI00397972E7